MYKPEIVLVAIEKAGIDVDLGKIEFSDNLLKQHKLDSLDMFNLFIEIQEETGVTIPDEDIDGLTSISLIVEYLNSAR